MINLTEVRNKIVRTNVYFNAEEHLGHFMKDKIEQRIHELIDDYTEFDDADTKIELGNICLNIVLGYLNHVDTDNKNLIYQIIDSILYSVISVMTIDYFSKL